MKHHRFLKGIAFCLLAFPTGFFVFRYITSRRQHRKYEIDYTIPAIITIGPVWVTFKSVLVFVKYHL